MSFPTAAEARESINKKFETNKDNQRVRKCLETNIKNAIKKGYSYASCRIGYPRSNYKSTVDFFTKLGYEVYFHHTSYVDYIEVRW